MANYNVAFHGRLMAFPTAVIAAIKSSHTLMPVPSFIRIEEGSDRGPCPGTKQG